MNKMKTIIKVYRNKYPLLEKDNYEFIINIRLRSSNPDLLESKIKDITSIANYKKSLLGFSNTKKCGEKSSKNQNFVSRGKVTLRKEKGATNPSKSRTINSTKFGKPLPHLVRSN